ncbi:MAG TPA: RES family NAD+ phosphorylase [Iamia sp.]|jgi:hypothetical protein|nr:RES family NAD+ phosphorylase [Iamia sp.]
MSTSVSRRHWPSLFNDSGRGDTRFAPLERDGAVVPTLYMAPTHTTALLETAFHDIRPGAALVSSPIDLRNRCLVRLTTPVELRFVDLREEALGILGLRREQVSMTNAAHYPCTREWATTLLSRAVGGRATHGLAWDSRVAEAASSVVAIFADLLRSPASDAFVVFGDGIPQDAPAWQATIDHDDLTEGQGRLVVDDIANLLGATLSSG